MLRKEGAEPPRRARAPRSAAPPRRVSGEVPAPRGGGKLRTLFAAVACFALCTVILFLTTIPFNRQATSIDWTRGLIGPLTAFHLRSLRDGNATVDAAAGDTPLLRESTGDDSQASIPFVLPSDPHRDAELQLPLPDGPDLAAVSASFAADAWTVSGWVGGWGDTRDCMREFSRVIHGLLFSTH